TPLADVSISLHSDLLFKRPHILQDENFFLQAEDGIRDFHVTGVQTCALPIYPELGFQETRTAALVAKSLGALGYEVHTGVGKTEIGRASCREREESTVLAGSDALKELKPSTSCGA